MKPLATLYLVASSDDCNSGLHRTIGAALAAGIKTIQLREKHCDSLVFYRQALEVRKLTRRAGAQLIINDRIDIALAVSADGVHLGQRDLPVVAARRLLGPHAIIGLSVECKQHVLEANVFPVDYIGISPIFPTQTKPELAHFWGVKGLKWCRENSVHPCVAIGGITIQNGALLLEAGASALAVCGAICHASDPAVRTAEFMEVLRDWRAL